MNILNQILGYKKEEVRKLKQKYSTNSFKEMEYFEKPSLKIMDYFTKESLGIIAEIKKASPSKGVMREDFNHLKIAEIYFEEEVSAVSILTDKIFFKGNIKFLYEIAKEKQAPLLRKDFIINEFQVFESKANGADLILLICEALSKNQIIELSHAAYETGIDVLLELHSEEQLDKIDFTINKLIGINNRNLNDFTVDLSTTEKLRKKIPDEIVVVSESGINKKVDIKYLYDSGVNAVLVGEFLMKEKNVRDRLKELKEWCLIES